MHVNREIIQFSTIQLSNVDPAWILVKYILKQPFSLTTRNTPEFERSCKKQTFGLLSVSGDSRQSGDVNCDSARLHIYLLIYVTPDCLALHKCSW